MTCFITSISGNSFENGSQKIHYSTISQNNVVADSPKNVFLLDIVEDIPHKTFTYGILIEYYKY